MKKHLKLIVAMLSIATITLVGCGKEKNNEQSTEVEADDPRFVEATDRTREWFMDATNAYVSENVKDAEFKSYAKVYDVRTGVNENNVLQYTSADIYIYFNETSVDKQNIADFSDNFARKLASDGSAGDIKGSIYIVPESIYTQIEEGNHTQVEEKAKGIEGYSKFGFNYSGIGDAINSGGTVNGNETN